MEALVVLGCVKELGKRDLGLGLVHMARSKGRCGHGQEVGDAMLGSAKEKHAKVMHMVQWRGMGSRLHGDGGSEGVYNCAWKGLELGMRLGMH